MIKITKELIKELSDTIMIELSDEEAQRVYDTENKIVDEFVKVANMNVDGVEPLNYPFDVVNTYLRKDEDAQKITREDMMVNAPVHDEDYVLIKKVVK